MNKLKNISEFSEFHLKTSIAKTFSTIFSTHKIYDFNKNNQLNGN